VNVILLERVPSLGSLGSRVKVKPGFARNYLIPQGKALPANEANIARFEAKRAELEKAAEQKLEGAKQRASALQGVSISIASQAGEEGRLFGSVAALDIARALNAAGYAVQKSEVQLPASGPIRSVGEYDIDVYLSGSDVIAQIKVLVIAA
jgi:large subunit ribosomal protein L9